MELFNRNARGALRKTLIGSCLTVGLLGLGATVASADTYRFFQGAGAYTGPYSGATSVYAALSTINCPTVGACASDNISDPMNFSDDTTTLAVTAAGSDKVWGDFAPGFGGLGVSQNTASTTVGVGDDQIEGNEILTLTFNQNVKLLGIATLFQSGHETFGAAYPTVASITAAIGTVMLQYSTNLGVTWTDITFQAANTLGGFGELFGTTFSFKQKTGMPDFYISGLVTGPGRIDEVPIPAALPLFLGGLGIIALARKRRQKSKAAAA